ncbi:FAD-dependent oxidoreductase [Thalassotalea ponticola]|uniref:FAD-binding protein n=1 Tax=Thalassotalea ponticola TaxID=1523392 RepID=UPI0025B2CCC4|nr:FAD-binding protein [Thalassotalea ponticola]MDN3653441.1 FAD-dependent oxidoreductase [Thalassotalea ponticola]
MKTEYDVIVIGSGAGALTSALTATDQGLDVLVCEKSDKFGGTSALSGGGIWIPNNSLFKKMGGKDSFEDALTYLKAATQDSVSEERLIAYLEKAPEMVDYLHQHSQVRFAVAAQYPDYYPHLPGSLAGGRTLDPELYDSSKLNGHLSELREASPATLLMGKIGWTARDAHLAISRKFGWQWTMLKRIIRYKLDAKWRKKHNTKRDRRVGLGNSLIASLRASLSDRDVPIWLNSEFVEYIKQDNRVTGVVINKDGQSVQLSARKAVIMASGGFEQNQQLREKHLPQPTSVQWSATPPGQNTGQALIAGEQIDAATDLLECAWWSPTMVVPNEDKARGLFAERAFPGAIVVNAQGQRFTNEAGPYLEFGEAMYNNYQSSERKQLQSYVVFDSHFRFNYAMGPLMPAQIMPDRRLPKAWKDSVYYKADSLEALALQINVDANGLKQTVDKINQYAQSGNDQDFQRGGNVFDRYYGDRNVKPNPCLAPIVKGPFYAMPIQAGDIGTKGGLLTNEYAQVLSATTNAPIEGLYAIGNCSAAVMGRSYPGAGSTLGPAMTFGYIAANHIAQRD